jgi:hypothetical protein
MADRWRIAPILGVLAVVIGLTAAGCGGGGQDDVSAASITKAEFVTKANAACTRIHAQAQKDFDAYMESQEGESAAAPSSLGDLGTKFVIVPKQREVEEFVALGMPSENEGQAKAIVVAFEKGIRTAEEDPAAAGQDSTEAFGGPEKLAAEYGLEGC